MKRFKEPSQLVLCADVVDLVEHWERTYPELDAKYRHSWDKQKASKNLRKFNRKTLVN